VLFYVVLVCKCVLPPGDNPIAVNKYINIREGQTDRGKERQNRDSNTGATVFGTAVLSVSHYIQVPLLPHTP
jgi:hypothetical protein